MMHTSCNCSEPAGQFLWPDIVQCNSKLQQVYQDGLICNSVVNHPGLFDAFTRKHTF